jgi:Rod binding domain-containing protein
MMPLATAATGSPASSTDAYAKRVIDASRKFEAVLLNSLLGSLEHSFSALPGKKPDSVADDYHAMGMQALASTLAASGGFGIASMIVRNLLHTKGQGPNGLAALTKVSGPSADKST